jgi:adenylate cyclase
MAPRPHSDKRKAKSQDPSPVARSDPARRASEVESRWRRIWSSLHSRFARQIALAAVAIGTFAAVGHFIGGMIGWWHAYEITFGSHTADRASVPSNSAAARTDVQSLVLLPLVDESEVRDGDWFVDVLTNDLTAELGRLPGALVISANTARSYNAKTADPRDVARELGVRYVIHGRVRRDGELVRLDLQMVDGESGLQTWSQRVKLDRGRLAGGLGDVALQLARSLNVQTYRSSGAKAVALKSHEVQADDLAMQGWAAIFRGVTPENLREAARLFDRAVERDPRSTRALGGVAYANRFGAQFGWLPDRVAAMKKSEQATERLLEIDENDFYTFLARQGMAAAKGDWAAVLAITDATIERFPSHAPSLGMRSWALAGLGRFDECLDPPKQALRIGPRDVWVGAWNWMIANCHFMRGEYPQAVEYARIARQANPRLPLPPLTLAAALHLDGKDDEARKIGDEYRSGNPDFRVAHVEQRMMLGTEPRLVEGRQRLMDSLRAVGMP